MNIRTAAPDDAPAISRLNRTVQQLHADNEPDIFKPAGEDTFPPALVRALMADPRSHFLLAEEDGQPVGYLFATEDHRTENSLQYARRWLTLDQIAILPQYQSRGIGKALVERARALARELDYPQLVLSTWAFNNLAQRAFHRMGFRPFELQMSMPVDPRADLRHESQMPFAPVVREDAVTLREVTRENLSALFRLSESLNPLQQRKVAHNAKSIAEAHFEPRAWFRAVYAGEAPVGFVMIYLADRNDPDPEERNDFIWRFMIGAPYQGFGFGRKAMDALVELVRSRGGKRLKLSFGDGPGSPEGFYRRYGFERDGHIYDDEIGMTLEL